MPERPKGLPLEVRNDGHPDGSATRYYDPHRRQCGIFGADWSLIPEDPGAGMRFGPGGVIVPIDATVEEVKEAVREATAPAEGGK